MVVIGYSILKFQYRRHATPYHIAFHIPDKQEEIALKWVKARVSVLKSNGDEIVDFSNWNAKSLYFYDADKNILEFIARRDFYKPDSGLFSKKSLIGISEVGLATKNIEEKYELLKKNFGVEVFDGNFEKFCAIGDDEGLLITINAELKDWFPTNDKAFISDFKMSFIQNGQFYKLNFEKDQLRRKQ